MTWRCPGSGRQTIAVKGATLYPCAVCGRSLQPTAQGRVPEHERGDVGVVGRGQSWVAHNTRGYYDR